MPPSFSPPPPIPGLTHPPVSPCGTYNPTRGERRFVLLQLITYNFTYGQGVYIPSGRLRLGGRGINLCRPGSQSAFRY